MLTAGEDPRCDCVANAGDAWQLRQKGHCTHCLWRAPAAPHMDAWSTGRVLPCLLPPGRLCCWPDAHFLEAAGGSRQQNTRPMACACGCAGHE